MGEKSIQKKKFIVEKARDVFAEKGYKSVTMKDIVDACGISRGGLYLYFGSTRELFEAVIVAENTAEDEDESLERALKEETSASDLLALFIKEQKKSVLRKKGNLTIASYEYYSELNHEEEDNALKTAFDTAVLVAERMVREGVRTGEFYCEDPAAWARNLMYVIEGMKACGSTMGITEAAFDKEVLYALQQLVPEENFEA